MPKSLAQDSIGVEKGFSNLICFEEKMRVESTRNLAVMKQLELRKY
jgi:hypothetical protein